MKIYLSFFLFLLGFAQEFSFFDYLQGVWDVQRCVSQVKSNDFMCDSIKGRYIIKPEATNLIGNYFENDTHEITNEMDVFVDFNTPSSGVFQIGEPEAGEWFGNEGDVYQLLISANDKYTITIIPKQAPKDDDREIILFFAEKEKEPASFFQKYGMYLLIGVFLMNMFFTRKMQGAAPQQPQQQTPAATQAAPTTHSKKE